MPANPKQITSGISGWPEDERPRERLLTRGPHALADAELLAILLRVGMQGKSAVELGRELLIRFGSLPGMMVAPISAWEASEENRKKNEYAVAHFDRVNEHLAREGSPVRYKFNFLTQKNFGAYFQYLREGRVADYRSELDVKLEETDL